MLAHFADELGDLVPFLVAASVIELLDVVGGLGGVGLEGVAGEEGVSEDEMGAERGREARGTETGRGERGERRVCLTMVMPGLQTDRH